MQGWKRIEKYQFSLKKVIGEGSYATVYLGKSTETGESVAVKVIDKKIFLNAYNLKNIQSQIDIMKMVKHENIVKLHDIYQTTNNMYIITEFCQDGDLYRYLEKKHKLSENEAKKYLKHIMKGAKYLHSNGIIHRDLKPANILMKDETCKISDFGFAKSLQDQNTVMKSIVGTPLYMSPQILKKSKYTAKSDLWSIGLIYYQMLHGRTPWPASNEMQLLNGIYSKKVTFSKEISDVSKDFIKKCLQIHEEDRMGWQEAFQHRLLREGKPKPAIKDLFVRAEQKENYSTNASHFRPKFEQPTYIKNISSKLKKDLSEKALDKCHNHTPQSKKAAKTPKNTTTNVTPGKSMNNRVKNVLTVTPKKDQRKNLTGKKHK